VRDRGADKATPATTRLGVEDAPERPPPTLAAVTPFWYGMPPLQSLEVAVNADRFGFGEVWIGEMASFDAFALAAAAARETRQASLWIGALSPAIRDPVSLALGVNSVSILGGRPAHLALRTSTATIVRSWHGREWGGNLERVEEAVMALRLLLGGERGPGGFRLRSAVPGSQIGLAAFGPRMVDLASRVADRLVLNLLTPAQVTEFRGRTRLPITIWVPAALDPGVASLDQVEGELRAYLAAPAYAAMFKQAGLTEPAQIAPAVSALGDLSALRRRIAEYHAAGPTTVGLVPATAEDPGGERLLEALGEKAT